MTWDQLKDTVRVKHNYITYIDKSLFLHTKIKEFASMLHWFKLKEIKYYGNFIQGLLCNFDWLQITLNCLLEETAS